MNERKLQGPIRHQLESHHAESNELEDVIWREKRVRCSVRVTPELVKIRAQSYPDYLLAKSAIAGRVSQPIAWNLA